MNEILDIDDELSKERHSKIGIVSFVMALLFPGLVAILVQISKFIDSISDNNLERVYGSIVIAWLVVGVVTGAIGVIKKRFKKVFALLGLMLNAILSVGLIFIIFLYKG